VLRVVIDKLRYQCHGVEEEKNVGVRKPCKYSRPEASADEMLHREVSSGSKTCNARKSQP
jgi:hypothetical protein